MLNAVLALNDLDTKVFDSPSPGEAPRIYADHVTVPDAHLLFNGEFQRVGSNDLKIVGEDGQSFFIQDYFASDTRAHLMSPQGATLSASVVEALAGPLAPGQHAQAGGQAASTQPVIGRVDALSGSATVVRNGVTVSLNVGDTVRKGDVVQTSGSSSVAIVFTDGSTFSLNANARMVLDEFVYAAGGTGNTALISLVQGTFSFVAGQVAKNGDMKVETPVATMGIRGTAVLVEISANDGQTRFSVMVEPDGTTGAFNLYNKTTGALIGTVSNSQIGWVVSPVSPLQVIAQQVQKTQAELAQELGIVQQIFTIFDNNQQNPFVPTQDRGDAPDTNPQTAQGGGGSGTPPPDSTTSNNPLADLINTASNNPSTAPSSATIPLPTDPLLGAIPGSPPPVVTVTVSANKPPVAVDDPDGTQDGGDVTPDPDDDPDNDSDPEEGEITVITAQHVVPGESGGYVPTDDPVDIDEDGEPIEGAYGTLTLLANGTYTFAPNAAFHALTDGIQVVDTFRYTISDPFGATASAILTIKLTALNDAPTAIADTNSVQAAGLVGGAPTLGDPFATGNVLADDYDVDSGDSIKLVAAGAGEASQNFGNSLVKAFVGVYGTLLLFKNGSYAYTLNNFDADTIALGEGETGLDVFSYTIEDNAGERTTSTLTIEVTGANSAPVMTGNLQQRTGAVTEDNQNSNTAQGTLGVTDRDATDTHDWSVAYGEAVFADTAQGTYGTLAIDENGEWTYTLDNSREATQALISGQKEIETFVVKVTDSSGASVTREIKVTVNGVDDINNAPVVIAADTAGSVSAGNPISSVAANYLIAGNSLINGLGGDADFGEYVLNRNDDGSTPPIEITTIFNSGLNFFRGEGASYFTSIYINNNGNVTFNGPLSAFTPQTIAGGTNNPIIAPFWADVDTRGVTGAEDVTAGGNSTGSNLVYYDLDAASGVVTITWDDVGYFSSGTDKLNAFQLQLIDRGGGDFDIVFRYEDINWTTGSASGGSGGLGGTPARAGYTAGDGNPAHYVEIAGSGNPSSMLALESTSGNTGINGVHVFEVRAGAVGNPTSSGTIVFSDADTSDTHTVSASLNTELSSHVTALGTLNVAVTSGTTGGANGLVTWHYVADPDAVNDLPPGAVETEIYDVVISDGHGGSVTQQVTITISSAGNPGEAPVISVEEATSFHQLGEGHHSDSTTIYGLAVTDEDAGEGEIFHISITAEHGTLSPANQFLNQFDEDQSPQRLSFHATLADINNALSQGVVYTDPSNAAESSELVETVTLTVTDVNNNSDSMNFIFSFLGDSGATLTGTAQKDVLFSTIGNDTFTGGAGSDTFVFGNERGSLSGHDTITDFTQGEDRIALYGYYNDYDDLVASGAFTYFGDNRIDLGGGQSITLQNFNGPLSNLTPNDFLFHNGNMLV